MVYKFVQINIYKGKYLDDLIKFLRDEDPDFISMQEVSSGDENLCEDKKINLFDFISQELQMEGAYGRDFTVIDSQNDFQGNAVLSKFPIISSNIVVLKPHMNVLRKNIQTEVMYEKSPRHLMDLKVNIGAKQIHILSWHGAWTAPPHDTEETLKQAKIAQKYLEGLKESFILGCDLNIEIKSKTVGFINKITKNLMLEANVKYTTNIKVHKISPLGYAIDYIFVSDDFKVKSLKVPEITVSDHLPVIAEVEI